MIRALEKITDINMMKRRRGRIARVFENHPDVEGRVARLRSRAGVDLDTGRDRAA